MANADATDAQVLTMQDAPTLEFSCGIDGAQRWIDKILRSSLKLKSSLSKSELVSIIQTGEHHDIEWANEELIREKTPSLTTSQVAAIVAVQDKRCAQGFHSGRKGSDIKTQCQNKECSSSTATVYTKVTIQRQQQDSAR